MLTDSYMANEETFPTCGYLLFDTAKTTKSQKKYINSVENCLFGSDLLDKNFS